MSRLSIDSIEGRYILHAFRDIETMMHSISVGEQTAREYCDYIDKAHKICQTLFGLHETPSKQTIHPFINHDLVSLRAELQTYLYMAWHYTKPRVEQMQEDFQRDETTS
jgi:hypothetical protein